MGVEGGQGCELEPEVPETEEGVLLCLASELMSLLHPRSL